MDFAEWLDQPVNEDWGKVWGAIKNTPEEGPLALWNKFRREREDTKKATLAKQKADSPPQETSQEDVKKAEGWWQQLMSYAEQGRHAAEQFFMSPDADVAKQFTGDQGGDPILTILKRMIGSLGKGLAKLLHTALVKILHLPAMYKFFRHDALKVGKDAAKGGLLALKYPMEGRAWGAAINHFFNLVRLPVAAVMMGVGAKLSYQQYQLIHQLGYTDVNLADVAKANVVLCWVLFLCFLTPHWLSNVENRTLKAIAFVMRHLFPQQMYKHHEGNMPNGMKFTEWANDYQLLVEDVSRYSIEVNYRTTKKDVLNAWAKLVLGFVSAALQREGYHVKHVYTDTPLRIMVTTNNWDDGAWTGMLLFNPDKESFVISSGFWNKDRRTISIQRQDTDRLAEDAAADLVRKLLNFMHDLKKRDPRKLNTLKPAPMKRGPKR